MNNKKRQINLSNDVLFNLVMQDAGLCKNLLEMVLGFPISDIKVTIQNTVLDGLYNKGIRMDVKVTHENGDSTVYDIEMQMTKKGNLGKRSRYYQGKLDRDALDAGEDYDKLPASYIIFICTYDPFGKGRYIYTVSPQCEEEPVDIRSDQKWIFLNTEGRDGDISQELKEFLLYVKDSCKKNAVNEYLQKLMVVVDEYINDDRRYKAMVTYEDKMLEERAQGERDGIQIGVLRTIDDIQSLVDGGMTLEEAFNAVKKSAKAQ